MSITTNLSASLYNRVNIKGVSSQENKSEDLNQPEKLQTNKTRSGQENTRSNSVADLAPEEKVELRGLQRRDKDVKAHEQAHASSGGSLVKGGATYSYKLGPDGKKYAVAGEVSIDTSSVSGDPGATIKRAQTVRRAAMSPADPSSADRNVASKATQMENKARMELAVEKHENQNMGASDKLAGWENAEEASEAVKSENKPSEQGKLTASSEAAAKPSAGYNNADIAKKEDIPSQALTQLRLDVYA